MRFAEYLDTHKHPPYCEYYIRYAEMAAKIPEKPAAGSAGAFFRCYKESFVNAFSFVRAKYDEFESLLGHIEDAINKRRKSAKQELADMLDEFEAYAEFIRVNAEGFRRIAAKYERRTGEEFPRECAQRLAHELERIDGLNSLIYAASRLKLKTISVKKSSESGTSFVRKTNKYWVHSENLAALKARIVEHLPVYVFSGGAPGDTPYAGWDYKSHDTCVSSVYFDNARFELYYGRLKKLQGAEAIRIRWYGSTVPDVVFVERKRHEESWTGEKSKKLRFKIYEADVVDYINGKDVWRRVKELNGAEVRLLYHEVQTAIVNKGLRPMVRSFYKRTAFQLPNDSSVRISLDTHLSMVRECAESDLRANTFPLTQWRRPDIVCEWPFADAPAAAVELFPHAVLEIKTQGVDETKPQWIEDLLQSAYAEHVHKFSKYMHGCVTLYSGFAVIPYWIPQMATDIRKDPYHRRGPCKVLVDSRLVDVAGESEAMTSTHLHPVSEHGKRIAMPARIEPKIHMANERTFLKWIKFAIFLGGVGTTMSSVGDRNAWLCGCVLNLVAVVFCFYAFYLWHWRNSRIYVHDLRPYDDRYGPTLLICMYIAAMAIIVLFKLTWKAGQ
ncbi:hypothetical protein PAPHI01_0181 [Pancytospora philotis]|nr:hypothetical protein PAPHI01_0181 [Pancytospora philotis]